MSTTKPLTLEAFGLDAIFKRLTEKPLPASFKDYIEPVALPGDNEYGVLDGCVSKGGIYEAWKTAPSSTTQLLTKFTPQQLEESFTMVGSRRIPNLPPPRPPMKRAAERQREKAEAEAAAKRAAQEAAERKAQQKAWKRQRLEAMEVDEKLKVSFVRTALATLVMQLKARKWDGWTMNDGNPFTVKFTKQNCVKLGVPDYFDFVTEPMDITRIEDKLAKHRYRTFEGFIADVRLMIDNAQAYNKAGEPVHEMAGELWRDFTTEWLPAAQHSYNYMLMNQKEKQLKEEIAAARAMEAANAIAVRKQ